MSLLLLLTLALTPTALQLDDEPAAAAGPREPIRATFYYPWFTETWHDNDHFTPSLGRYSSDDTSVLAKHFASMKYAGLDAAISSWWGPGHRTDRRLPMVLDAAASKGMSALPYYEPEYGNNDPSVDTLRKHLDHLKPLTRHRAWLHVDGKPVIFVYNAGATGCGDVTRWKKATNNFSDYYVSLKLFSGYTSCPDQPSTWHQYGPASPRSVHMPYSDNVSPGFWHHEEAKPRLARDLDRFKRDLAAQVRTGARWQLVTSFSEWGEGTAVESAKQWASASGHGKYLDAMREAYVGDRAPAPQPDPQPKPQPKPEPRGTAVRVPAVADSFVNSARPRANHADARVLRVDRSPRMRSFLKFRVEGTPRRAVLKMYARNANPRGFRVVSAPNAWRERGITHRAAPQATGFRAGSGAVRAGSWTRVDVSDLVTGSGTYSFAVTSRSDDRLRLASSESARKPRLVVTYPKGDAPSEPVTPEQPAPSAPQQPTSGTTVAWAVGDSCDDDHEELDCDDVGTLIADDKATDAVLALGDLQYETGTLEAFKTWYDPKMGAGKGLKSITYPAVGNHEYLTPGAAGYFDYWGARAGDRDKGYYATDLGAWRLVVGNSNCGQAGGCSASSPQGRFIAAELAAAKDRCTVVLSHHPVITDGGYAPGTDSGKELFDLAYDGGAELFLSGHEHNYQRFAPLNKGLSVDRARGVTPFVVGTGGKNLTAFGSTNRSEYRQNTSHGALRLALGEKGYDFSYVGIDGKVRDSGSGTCR